MPDYGYYEPDRVGDDSFGLMSLDQIEDVLIMTWKKTELLGLLLNEYEIHHRNRSVVKSDALTSLVLRKGPDQALSRVPALKVTIQPDKKLDDTDVKLLMSDISSGANMTIQVTEGIPEHVVEARKLRQRERARQAEIIR